MHVNGAKYEGQWKDDLQDGYGIETWSDGSRYEGYYKESKKHGEGILFLYVISPNTFEQEHMFGQMDQHILEVGSRIKYQAK